MAHVRTQIRDRLMTILAGLTTTGDRVYWSRVHPMTVGTMPGICVYCGKEEAVGGTLTATEKAVDIVVDAYVSGSDYDYDAAQIQAEVEAALYADFTNGRYFNGIVTNLAYSMAESEYFGDAAVVHGMLRMIYKATYKTEDGDAEIAT